MKILKFVMFLSLTSCVMGMGNGLLLRTVKVNLKVVDKKGKPVKNADTKIFFIIDTPKGRIGGGGGWGTISKSDDKFGKSNNKGLFSAKGKTNTVIPIYVNKKGYYESHKQFEYEEIKRINNVTLTLKKKRNPVAMYAKCLIWGGDSIKPPVFNKAVGYDLEIGDWVNPYGKGKIRDFIFNVKSNEKMRKEYNSSYTLTFSNPNDGIQEYKHTENDQSSYQWSFIAPINGYENNFSRYRKYIGDELKTNLKKEKTKYLFRVRTKVDKNGNIISANYGKIKEEIILTTDGEINFHYYFNPNPKSNSLEFSGKNLFDPDKKKRDADVRNLLWDDL